MVVGGVAVYFWKGSAIKAAISLKNSHHNVITQITIDARGNSGNVIQDVVTGIVYPSQNACAEALKIHPRQVSTHLNGKNPTAGGHILKKLIDGGVGHTLDLAR